MKNRTRSRAAKKAVRTKGPEVLRRAGEKAVAGLPTDTLSREAMSRQGRDAAARRSPVERSRSAKQAVRTKGSAGRSRAARKAARTRARRR
jgi:hypothetical protein